MQPDADRMGHELVVQPVSDFVTSMHSMEESMVHTEKQSKAGQAQTERQVLDAELSWARERAKLERMRQDFDL